jgi:phosphoenolpyruvate synthase/pyruvate phosphate dikinase
MARPADRDRSPGDVEAFVVAPFRRHGEGPLALATVTFTQAPASNGAQDRVVIEGAFGLGDVVVSGEVELDTYIVYRLERDA